ncbi:NAD(P)/FAD-dependent oxidoreductase [Chelatococcus asaccharovorans]|uniref:NAD(P)/FAD-dependent oxidoreductase n=1 Tax=Chelatococcus asaccharovorans TaxID=28210 RepID=UPI00226443D2|nr:FAD-dependent oxidoreductase [Chelatococcus asaccharovorans]
MTSRRTEIAIIGGGAMGAWTAFHLARRGARVMIVERSFPGAQASGVNYGSMRIQGRFLPQLPLSLRAQRIWEESEKLLGTDVEFRRTGHLHVAVDAAQQAKIERYAVDALAYGLGVEILAPAAIRRRWPWIAPHAIAASWSAIDGAVNPRLVVPALAARLAALDVAVLQGRRVTGAERLGAGFRLETAEGDVIEADMLVNTGGAWGADVAAWFAEPVPMFVAGPSEMVTEPLPYFMQPTLQIVDGSIVIRQVERGNVIIAGHPRGPADALKMRARMPGAKTLTNLQRVADIIPCLSGASIIRTWSGIEGYMPDMIPIIGPSATTPGLWHAFAFSGHGMQLCPGLGAVLSELILDGRSETPVGAFAIDRFRQTQTVDEDYLRQEFDAGVVKA